MTKPLSIDKAVDGNLKPVKDSGGTLTALEVSTDDVRIKNVEILGDTKLSSIKAGEFSLDAGGDITLTASSKVYIVGANLIIDAGNQLFLDAGSDTYIYEVSSDNVRYVVGGDTLMQMTETGLSGNTVDFLTSGVGFTQATVGFDATDTYCYFHRVGNKAHLTMTADIVDVHLYFPNVSCNCQLVVLQDGTGGWDVSNWKTFDQAGGNERPSVFWSGGSAPPLTETADKLDILSFYWDNDNHKAYGVASTNF